MWVWRTLWYNVQIPYKTNNTSQPAKVLLPDHPQLLVPCDHCLAHCHTCSVSSWFHCLILLGLLTPTWDKSEGPSQLRAPYGIIEDFIEMASLPKSSLCPVLSVSLPFHGCGSQEYFLKILLNTKSISGLVSQITQPPPEGRGSWIKI